MEEKYNLWKSDYTGEINPAPTDWMPKFDGWQLIGTITKQEALTWFNAHK